jgi:hypothetical protein
MLQRLLLCSVGLSVTKGKTAGVLVEMVVFAGPRLIGGKKEAPESEYGKSSRSEYA